MEEIEETNFILTTYGSKQNLQLFCCNLPKIELHAHINGSISSKTLQDLVDKKKDKKPHLSNFKIPKKRLAVFYDFFEIFKLVYQLIDDEESLAYVTESIILDFENDDVKYLELRSTPRKNENNGMTKESYVKTIIYTIQKLSITSKIIVRLILSIDRSSTLEEAIETVDLAIKYKELGVVGVDLCGNPSKGHFDNLKQAFIKAQNNGLKVTLHFGEVDETIPEHPSMLSISPDRIGHATHLDPDSKKYLAENPIPIEMCMTSNILSNSVKSYQEHHVKDFLFIKYPCCLSTDDKGVFFSDLSDEYAIAASTFSLTQQQLYELSYQCIDCIFDNDVTKEHLKTLWKDWWKNYENSIIN